MSAASGWTAYEPLSNYTKAAVGLSVDQLLLQGCLDGRLPGRLADFATVVAARTNSHSEPDGIERWSYTGTLTVQGVAFDFECDICYNPTREVYAIEVLNIEPVEWTARLVMA